MNDFNFRKPLSENRGIVNQSLVRISSIRNSDFSPIVANKGLQPTLVIGEDFILTEGMIENIKKYIVNLFSKEPLLSQILSLRREAKSLSKSEYTRRVDGIKKMAGSYLFKAAGIGLIGMTVAYQTGLFKVLEKVIHHLALEPHSVTEIGHIVHTVLHMLHLVTDYTPEGEEQLTEAAGAKTIGKLTFTPFVEGGEKVWMVSTKTRDIGYIRLQKSTAVTNRPNQFFLAQGMGEVSNYTLALNLWPEASKSMPPSGGYGQNIKFKSGQLLQAVADWLTKTHKNMVEEFEISGCMLEAINIGTNAYEITGDMFSKKPQFILYKLGSQGSVRFSDGRKGTQIGTFKTKEDAMAAAKRNAGVK